MSVDYSPGFAFVLNGHLWVVVAELSGDTDQVIIVSLTTIKVNSDTTVVFDVGDHPFIKHKTVISYIDARPLDKSLLIRRIEQRDFDKRQPFDADKVKLIQKGLLQSTFTSKDIKMLCMELFRDSE